MNVLYFVRAFPKLSESFVLSELYGLTQRGHSVSVFARERPDESIRHDEYAEVNPTITYAERPSLRDVPALLHSPMLTPRVLRKARYFAHPKYHIAYLHFATQCIEHVESLDAEIDHVHCHFGSQDKLAAIYVAAYFDVPCTVTVHAQEIFSDPDSRMLRVLLERMDRVLVPSRYNRSYLREHFGVRTPIDIVPATTRLSKFTPTDREVPTRLLTVARLTEKKGIGYAIEALARLAETHSDIEYHIVGTGELEDELRRRADELGVTDRVTFLHNVSDERLRQEYDEAAAFVLPCVIAANGDRDGSPVALKEAMAMRTPCVSTTVTGVPEMIEDGTSGLVVEPRDAEALAGALATVLDDEERRTEMGRNARETIHEKYSLNVAVDALLTSFRKANTGYSR